MSTVNSSFHHWAFRRYNTGAGVKKIVLACSPTTNNPRQEDGSRLGCYSIDEGKVESSGNPSGKTAG